MAARRRCLAVLAAFAIAAAGALPSGGPAPVAAASSPAADPASKLRGDLAALVAGDAALDPRIAALVPGLRAGELPYLVGASDGSASAARAADLVAAGARVLRAYRSIPAFAVVSDATSVLRVAALPWTARLAPVELVVALDDQPVETDQTTTTAGDLGVDDLWAAGLTGSGMRIAVLDTGWDPAHPDLDDLDFRHWSAPVNPLKVVDARDFTGGACRPGVGDGHGHGTHVAGIATGTGEGTPAREDDAAHTGIAPDAELAVGKVMTDAGAGLNSDLIAALEWAAMPAEGPTGCAVGADVVNLSLGSESRPDRLNSGTDIDFVSQALNTLAVRYGTVFVAAIGNSGPYIGSGLEAPGSASQAISVAAAAKDHDVNNDETESGDACAGWRHPPSGTSADNFCPDGGDQPPSLSTFSSRGPAGDLWLRPDVAAPGHNIVSAQATHGTAMAANDLSPNTRDDPLYANGSGTSMAAPATAGVAALVLEAYRERHGADPTGAPAHALVRAALMNTAGSDLFDSRWKWSPKAGVVPDCPPVADLFFGLCSALGEGINEALTHTTVSEVRNRGADPYVGPLAEGAGKIRPSAAVTALRDGIVVYSAPTGDGTGPRSYQGTWQVGAVTSGSTVRQRFVVHSAPGSVDRVVSFSFAPGNPSDVSASIDRTGWSVELPAPVTVGGGDDVTIEVGLTVPAAAAPGAHTGVLLAAVSGGEILRIPVFASVALGPGEIQTDRDVYARHDTIWPSAAGQSGTGSGADWLAYPLDLAGDLGTITFEAWDTDGGTDTYDVYLYDVDLDLIASSHPFAARGVTDVDAHQSRPGSTAAAPTRLEVRTPAAGRHTLVVSRSRVGRTGTQTTGDFGSFALRYTESRDRDLLATTLGYEGDQVLVVGRLARLAARLIGEDGEPVAGRAVTFAGASLTCSGAPCTALTDYQGVAQVASDPVTAAPGVNEIRATFGGDSYWGPSESIVPVLVLGASPPPVPTGGRIHGGGWIVGKGDGKTKAHFAFEASSATGLAPTGDLRWRDPSAGIDVRLVAATTLTIEGDRATLRGTVQDQAGAQYGFELSIRDVGNGEKGSDEITFRLEGGRYARAGRLGGGNVRVER